MIRKDSAIICIGFPKWDGNYAKSTIMLMKRLAATSRVVYVDYQHTFKDLLYGLINRKAKIPIQQMTGLKKRLIYKDNTYILTPPPSLPINWIKHIGLYQSLLRLNNRILRNAILKAMKELDIQNPVIINAFNPFYGIYNYHKFNESCHIYYSYDEIGHAKWMNRHGQRLEDIYARKVDAVVVSSAPLLQKMKAKNKFSYLVENGVDFDLFNKNTGKKGSSAIETIGYTGSIDERLDFNYLKVLACKLPHVKFKFVGRIADDRLVKDLMKLENVDFEPPVDYNRLPSILNEFDLCLIPFVKNEFTRNIYPMKINEYLAAGKLTLMTNFAALPEFNDIVFKEDSAETASSLIRNLDLSAPNVSDRIQRGIAIAGRASWESRAGEFIKIIEIHRNSRTA